MNRSVCIALLTVCAPFSALAQTPTTTSEGEVQDESAIRTLMGNVADAWNKHDVAAFSMLFAEDADFTNWRADLRVHGREEIKRAHADLFAGMFRRSKLTVISTRIRSFAPGVAAVDCEWELVGAIDYDGKGIIPPRKYFPLFIVTKENGKWSIAVMHNILFQPLPPGAITGPRKQ